MSRPDSELPPELMHENIREVRNVSSSLHFGYQIVFDQGHVPYAYARNIRRDGWELEYARVEYHGRDGFLSFLWPDKPRICIVVSRDRPDNPLWDRGDGE